MKITRYFTALFITLTINTAAQDTTQNFLPLKPTGVAEFLARYPESDGRGTTIFIFDTGVDVGIEGLKHTSSGTTKIIDVLDLSGEGDIKLQEAQNNGNSGVYTAGMIKVTDLDKLPIKAIDGRYFLGVFDEVQLKNSTSGVKDINGNGAANDKYLVAVLKATLDEGPRWIAYFDTDGDGMVSDERPLRSYREKFDTFEIKNPKRIPYFTFALNILPSEMKLNLFFDDGAHGTHVAGIASGYKIGKIEGFNGVAPGANVIAVKISDNTLNGITITESMKKAFLFADSLSRVLKTPCIINMSFGIGSAIEASSDMEKFLDNMLKQNPYLYVFISNGNSGPGLSSAGLPASASTAFSSGAILVKETGRDLYGADLKEDIILHFSARGGETAKPDVCSPGASVSTVPNWSANDRMWGTSMASPYTTGIASLLLSAVKKNYPNRIIPAQLLYKAIRQGAKPIKGYTVLDQGAGYINVVSAYSALEKYIKDNKELEQEEYAIVTEIPNSPIHKASNIFIRNIACLEENGEVRAFVTRSGISRSTNFYRTFNIVSDAKWIQPVQQKTYMRNTQGTIITLNINKLLMKEPGLYTATISAFDENRKQFPEFTFNASVVRPYEFESGNKYMLEFNNQKVNPGKHERFFFRIPPAAGALKISLNKNGKAYTDVLYRLFDPDGVKIYTSESLSSEEEESVQEKTFSNLKPGVYELVVHGSFLATGISTYSLAMELNRISIVTTGTEEAEQLKLNSKGSFIVNNYSEKTREFLIEGSLTGFQKEFDLELQGHEKEIYPFILRKGEASRHFKISLSKEDFNKLTDFSVMILDSSKTAVVKEALEYPEGEIEVKNEFKSDSTQLYLMLVPAFTHKTSSARISVVENGVLADSQKFELMPAKVSSIKIYPDVKEEFKCGELKPGYFYPSDTKPCGQIIMKSPATGKIEFEKEFIVNTL